MDKWAKISIDHNENIQFSIKELLVTINLLVTLSF